MLLNKCLVALLLVAVCAGARADDDCQACNEKKSKSEISSPIEKARRCGNPIKIFFVHTVGGTIGNGLNKVPGKFEGAFNSTAQTFAPKPDCGCKQ